jgi:hypothetical protein
VGEAEYMYVCDPGKVYPAGCPSKRREFTSFCMATLTPPAPNGGAGFSAAKLDLALDARTFFPCS